MHVCVYVCISVRWWLASGMHANAFYFIVCESWQRDACMYECHTKWYVQCMVDDGWMIVMNGSGDAWFVLVKE